MAIIIDVQERELYEFTIIHGAYSFRIGCYLHRFDDILLLLGVDVDGPGQNSLRRQIHLVLSDVCREFCDKFQTKSIIILGAKRTVGKTEGRFFLPIYRRF